jgi:hypothetical protein
MCCLPYLEYSHISLGKKIYESETAQLHMFGNDAVAKTFFLQNPLTEMNAEIIKNVVEHYAELSKISELVLPSNLLVHHGYVVGYTMPYINGVTLGTYLRDDSGPYLEKISVVSNIAAVIQKVSKLGFYFAFGDLHEENVIISHGQIYFIDLDGVHIRAFRPTSGRYIHNLPKRIILKAKYPFIRKFPRANYNTDLYCLITIVMNWFLGEQVRFDYLTRNEVRKYIQYLRLQGFGPAFESMILQVYRVTHNYFDAFCFPVTSPDFDRISWDSFINSPYEAEDLNSARETLNCYYGKY